MNRSAWWILVIVVFLLLAGWAYLSTRHHDKVDAAAAANGTGVGTAYDPTTGKTVPAAARPGALNAGAAPTVSPLVVTTNATGS